MPTQNWHFCAIIRDFQSKNQIRVPIRKGGDLINRATLYIYVHVYIYIHIYVYVYIYGGEDGESSDRVVRFNFGYLAVFSTRSCVLSVVESF